MHHNGFQALGFLLTKFGLITFKLSILLTFNDGRYLCSDSIYSKPEINVSPLVDTLQISQENENKMINVGKYN